jgi:ferredoxin
MDIRKVGDCECISCGDCKAACKFDAIHFGWERKKS